MSDEPIWTPSPARAAATELAAFMRLVHERHGVIAGDYQALHRWSVDHPQDFWPLVWALGDIRAARQADVVLADGDRMPGARWFVGAELNFAGNLLGRRDDGETAIIARNEAGARRTLSWAELARQVAAAAEGLRALGVAPGDRVAGLMPNVPETVIAALAAAAVGAVWSSASPEFGASAVIDRFGQIDPKVLVAVNGYRYNGRRHDLRDKVAAVAGGLPSLAGTVAVDDGEGPPLCGAGLTPWPVFAGGGRGGPEPLALPFDHPLYILYSSGTTGRPKCIVHGAGGTLLQHVKEHRLHTDLRAGDVLFYFTTCGWMMWNWLVSGLASGATLLLYDGAPITAARPEMLVDIAEEEGVAIFGASAKYLQALEKAGVRPAKSHRLPRLRTVLSTGSPLLPSQYDYVYRDFKDDVHLASISGGTDIVSCFVLGNPTAPVYRGEIQCAGLGMDVRVFDDEGRDLPRGTGELVCARPFPSMPIGFWNDAGGSRYRDAYFARFPGVWAHGDYAERTAHGGFVIHGRSDATLNPGGVRIGTAEIYRQVETIDEVAESLVVGQEWQGDVRVVLFVRLQEGLVLDDALRERIRRVLRENASPRHVPAKIVQVRDIPRTMSGKIVELAVREVIHGRPVKNRDALANPEALEQFRDLPELSA